MEKEKDLPKRKDLRLKGFDYSKTGTYFLTICTQNRKNVLSTIVGEGFPLPQIPNVAKNREAKRLPLCITTNFGRENKFSADFLCTQILRLEQQRNA